MKFEKLQNYRTGENTYVVYNENTLNGFIIDPAYGTDKIIDFIKEKDINLKYIFITHCHYDHIENMEGNEVYKHPSFESVVILHIRSQRIQIGFQDIDFLLDLASAFIVIESPVCRYVA